MMDKMRGQEMVARSVVVLDLKKGGWMAALKVAWMVAMMAALREALSVVEMDVHWVAYLERCSVAMRDDELGVKSAE